MATTVKIEGLQQLANRLRQLPLVVAQKRLAKPVSDAAAMMRDMARALAPIAAPAELSIYQPVAGTLRKSIVVGRDRTVGASSARFYIAVIHGRKRMRVGKEGENKDAYYGRFVELGTAKMGARPYLRPAFEALKNTALTNIVSDIKSGIEAEATILAKSVR